MILTATDTAISVLVTIVSGPGLIPPFRRASRPDHLLSLTIEDVLAKCNRAGQCSNRTENEASMSQIEAVAPMGTSAGCGRTPK